MAYDEEFYEELLRYSRVQMRKAGLLRSEAAYETAMRNSSMQGAYLISAVRARRLTLGAMSGFNPTLLNETFFSDSTWKVDCLLNIGYGDKEKVHKRLPRLSFEQACHIV